MFAPRTRLATAYSNYSETTSIRSWSYKSWSNAAALLRLLTLHVEHQPWECRAPFMLSPWVHNRFGLETYAHVDYGDNTSCCCGRRDCNPNRESDGNLQGVEPFGRHGSGGPGG